MRTRRSWRNQDRLYKAIGRDLQRAADASAQVDATPDEAKRIMGELHELTQKDAPQLEAPFTLTGEIAHTSPAKQPGLFGPERPRFR